MSISAGGGAGNSAKGRVGSGVAGNAGDGAKGGASDGTKGGIVLAAGLSSRWSIAREYAGSGVNWNRPGSGNVEN